MRLVSLCLQKGTQLNQGISAPTEGLNEQLKSENFRPMKKKIGIHLVTKLDLIPSSVMPLFYVFSGSKRMGSRADIHQEE